MTAIIIPFADHRAAKLVRDLIRSQEEIDASARGLLAGKKVAENTLSSLLDRMDAIISGLRSVGPTVSNRTFRKKIETTTRLHRVWSHARLGSVEERDAAAEYLDSITKLEQALNKPARKSAARTR